jgi:hypothetical protein
MVNIKEIISTAVSENRDSYSKLTEHERHQLVSALLFDSDQMLLDADNELVLQKAIAQTIFCNNDIKSIENLTYQIKRIFIIGDAKSEAYYAHKINMLLTAEWMAQNAKPNEHFEHDVMNRTRDAQLAMHPLHY